MERNRSDENIFSSRRPSGAAVMQSDVTDALTSAFFSGPTYSENDPRLDAPAALSGTTA